MDGLQQLLDSNRTILDKWIGEIDAAKDMLARKAYRGSTGDTKARATSS
jgi:hypothetical protein